VELPKKSGVFGSKDLQDDIRNSEVFRSKGKSMWYYIVYLDAKIRSKVVDG